MVQTNVTVKENFRSYKKIINYYTGTVKHTFSELGIFTVYGLFADETV